MLVCLLYSFIKLSKEVLSTPVFFLFIALWVWLPSINNGPLPFSVTQFCPFLWIPRGPHTLVLFDDAHFHLFIYLSLLVQALTHLRVTSASCSALARWVFSWALAQKRKKGKRLWEAENWYLIDCRLRKKCSWLQPCAVRGPFGGSRSKARQCEPAKEGVRST